MPNQRRILFREGRMKALEIINLSKTYPTKVVALQDISFSVENGDFFALLGPNGAGKTTTIGIIAHLVNKSSGTVKVFGVDSDKDENLAKSYIGLVPQEFNFNIFERVIDIVVQQAGYYGVPRTVAVERADALLKQLGLSEKRNATSNTLSGGMKRKLMIVRALVHNPRLLILDEPTAGVDVETRREMWDFLNMLNKKGTTIILTTHYLEEAEQMCKNITIIHKGKVIENTSMKHLLTKLDRETFIVDLKDPIDQVPESKEFKLEKKDKSTLIVEVSKKQDINAVFMFFEMHNIKVLSLRNKVNRLEELFVNLTRKK